MRKIDAETSFLYLFLMKKHETMKTMKVLVSAFCLASFFPCLGWAKADYSTETRASAVETLQTTQQAATVEVKGVVKDQTGLPVIGATIVEKGHTTNGTVTDIDGNFTLRLPADGTLVISFIGYTTQEIPLNGQTQFNVTLEEDSETLDEVVVVGYGAIQKRSVSTSISTVEGGSIAEMPTSNISQSLVGMSSGITIQQISGEPGAAPAIRIRGAGSINSGNDPLYVIDGYPTTDAELFNNINPSDIADIQILKDAASSAIYGSKAGNGVIIVTTKQGQSGKPKVSFNTKEGWSEAMLMCSKPMTIWT